MCESSQNFHLAPRSPEISGFIDVPIRISPDLIPTDLRIFEGIVVCPLDVTLDVS